MGEPVGTLRLTIVEANLDNYSSPLFFSNKNTMFVHLGVDATTLTSSPAAESQTPKWNFTTSMKVKNKNQKLLLRLIQVKHNESCAVICRRELPAETLMKP